MHPNKTQKALHMILAKIPNYLPNVNTVVFAKYFDLGLRPPNITASEISSMVWIPTME